MRSDRDIWESPEDTRYLEKDLLGKKRGEGRGANIEHWDTPTFRYQLEKAESVIRRPTVASRERQPREVSVPEAEVNGQLH